MSTVRIDTAVTNSRAGLGAIVYATVYVTVCATLLGTPGTLLAGAGVFEQAAKPLAGAPAFDEHAGTVGLMVLFQPECPWCVRQFDAAGKLANDRPDIAVIAVGLRGRRMELIRELRRARAQLPAYLASPELLETLGKPEGTPRLYVFDRHGRIVAWAAGYHDPAQLAYLIASAGELGAN